MLLGSHPISFSGNIGDCERDKLCKIESAGMPFLQGLLGEFIFPWYLVASDVIDVMLQIVVLIVS